MMFFKIALAILLLIPICYFAFRLLIKLGETLVSNVRGKNK